MQDSALLGAERPLQQHALAGPVQLAEADDDVAGQHGGKLAAPAAGTEARHAQVDAAAASGRGQRGSQGSPGCCRADGGGGA
jgi:hypothetical protein